VIVRQPDALMFYDCELHISPSDSRKFTTQVTSRAWLFAAFF
jgi:hypothetical protein